MPTIRNRLYPLRDVNDHDVLPFYSHMTTGVAGQLVKIVTGAANPQNMEGWSQFSVGASVAGAISLRPESKAKFIPTVSGDTRFDAIGLTLYTTSETDENGILLKYNTPRAKEINSVVSGENVPVAQQGMFGIWGNEVDKTLGNIQPGNLVVISRSGDGRLASVDPDGTNFRGASFTTPGATGATAAWVYDPSHVVGKWLTSLPTAANTGLQNEFSAQGGYAWFTLNVK